MSSKKMTLNADGTATVAEASIADVFTSYYDRDVTLTGLYGIGRDLLTFGVGYGTASYVHTGNFFRVK